MKASEYQKIKDMNPEERDNAIEEEKKRVYAEGARSATVYAYLKDYFEIESINNFKAFEELPIDAELVHYQTVKHNLSALRRLEFHLKSKVAEAKQITEKVMEEDAEGFEDVNV